MGAEQWISASSAAIFLALGALAVARADRSPLAPPTAVLCSTLFAYDALEVIVAVSEGRVWTWLDAAAASLVAPPTLHLVAAFLGERRRLRVPLGVATAYFAALALACASPIVFPALAPFPNGPVWAALMLGGIVPSFAAMGYLLVRHVRDAADDERGRAQLLAVALLLGVGAPCSDLLAIVGEAPSRIAAFGLVASAVLLTALALRARVVESRIGLFAANAVALAALTALAQLLILAWLGDSTLLVLVAGIALTLAALAALRPLAASLAEERARTRNLATLGRFSAQMAHDLKNPLAAIKGAAQFLDEEKRQGRSLDEHHAFVELILEQADRLGRVVDQYQRLGRVEAVVADIEVRSLVDEVVSAQRAAAGARITVKGEAEGVGRAMLDRDLVAGALENMVRNAREAIGDAPGTVVVRAQRDERGLLVCVEDDGPGMDARTRERAFDEFFTTKASGSGLGLAFVGRVASAHGGRARVLPRQPRGTIVEMRFPPAAR